MPLLRENLEQPLAAGERKPILMVGMMGAGKSTIGKALSQKLDRPWVDCDSFIEKEQGLSIQEIFAQYGEGAFRKMEVAAVKKLLDQNERAVISLGGGAFVDDEIRKLCKAKAITIWLKAEIDTLLNRLNKDENRPLLASLPAPLLTGKNKKEYLENLLKTREPFYQKADIAVETKNNIEETIQKIIDRLSREIHKT